MVVDEREDETLKDFTKSIEQGDGVVGRGISLSCAMFKDEDNFSTLSGAGKRREEV